VWPLGPIASVPYCDPMARLVDDAYLEILASAICHDLLSPIGAVTSGVEFIEEAGPGANIGADSEALDLIAASARAASARLQLLRAAWGGMGANADFGPNDARTRMDALLGLESRVVQDWAPEDLSSWSGPGAGKALLLALMVGAECLPRGGTLRVREQAQGLLIEATGERASLRPHVEAALLGQTAVIDLPPDTVHAAIAGLLLARHGFALSPRAHMEGRAAFFLKRAP
jgi:histidine phosphotransferase ChpT